MSNEYPNSIALAVSDLGKAYSGACSELGIGLNSLDLRKRERVANVLVRLFTDGERDTEVLKRRAVLYVMDIDESSLTPPPMPM
jgi:hypothetical protein